MRPRRSGSFGKSTAKASQQQQQQRPKSRFLLVEDPDKPKEEMVPIGRHVHDEGSELARVYDDNLDCDDIDADNSDIPMVSDDDAEFEDEGIIIEE